MSSPSDSLQELLKFLQLGARLDLKAIACEHVLLLTGSEDGLQTIIDSPQLLVSLLSLLGDQCGPIAKDAALALVNISADEKGASELVDLDVNKFCPALQAPPKGVVRGCFDVIFDSKSALADQCCMILSNITRNPRLVEKVVDILDDIEEGFSKLIDTFTKIKYNTAGCTLHYLGPLFSNLSQNHQIRKFLLDKKHNVMQRLLSFTTYKDSLIRRGGVVGTVKNCCFEEEFHDYLLSEEVDILPYLLLPLAGNEEFDEEDNNKLPIDLQYLPSDKLREEDPDIRLILIEALTQLVTKKSNREFVREKNAYVILRELHKWEKDSAVLAACEHLVNILIRTEDEIGLDNLKDVDIPAELLQETS